MCVIALLLLLFFPFCFVSFWKSRISVWNAQLLMLIASQRLQACNSLCTWQPQPGRHVRNRARLASNLSSVLVRGIQDSRHKPPRSTWSCESILSSKEASSRPRHSLSVSACLPLSWCTKSAERNHEPTGWPTGGKRKQAQANRQQDA